MFYLIFVCISKTKFTFPLITDSPDEILLNIQKNSFSNSFIEEKIPFTSDDCELVQFNIAQYLDWIQCAKTEGFPFYEMNDQDKEQLIEWFFALPFVNEVNPDKFEIALSCMDDMNNSF